MHNHSPKEPPPLPPLLPLPQPPHLQPPLLLHPSTGIHRPAGVNSRRTRSRSTALPPSAARDGIRWAGGDARCGAGATVTTTVTTGAASGDGHGLRVLDCDGDLCGALAVVAPRATVAAWTVVAAGTACCGGGVCYAGRSSAVATRASRASRREDSGAGGLSDAPCAGTVAGAVACACGVESACCCGALEVAFE